jgi:hypothetical protein
MITGLVVNPIPFLLLVGTRVLFHQQTADSAFDRLAADPF